MKNGLDAAHDDLKRGVAGLHGLQLLPLAEGSDEAVNTLVFTRVFKLAALAMFQHSTSIQLVENDAEAHHYNEKPRVEENNKHRALLTEARGVGVDEASDKAALGMGCKAWSILPGDRTSALGATRVTFACRFSSLNVSTFSAASTLKPMNHAMNSWAGWAIGVLPNTSFPKVCTSA